MKIAKSKSKGSMPQAPTKQHDEIVEEEQKHDAHDVLYTDRDQLEEELDSSHLIRGDDKI